MSNRSIIDWAMTGASSLTLRMLVTPAFGLILVSTYLATAAEIGRPPLTKEGMVSYLDGVDNLLQSINCTYTYECNPKDGAVPYFRAVAMVRSLKTKRPPASGSLDSHRIQRWLSVKKRCEVFSEEGRYRATIRDQGTNDAVRVTQYLYDGFRFYINHDASKRWDIVAEDLLPVPLPSQVMYAVPEAVPAIRYAGGMESVSLSRFMRDANSRGHLRIVQSNDERIVMSASMPVVSRDGKESVFMDCVDAVFAAKQRVRLGEIISCRTTSNLATKGLESVNENAKQRIRFKDYRTTSAGIDLPFRIEMPVMSSISGFASKLSSKQKEDLARGVGLSLDGLERALFVSEHIFTIEDVNFPKGESIKAFRPPEGPGVFFYNYATREFQDDPLRP